MSKESGDYTGFASTRPEIHAIGNGLKTGLTTHPLKRSPQPEEGDPGYEDYEKEPHYWNGAYVLGTLVQAGFIAYLVQRYGPEAAMPFLGMA